MRTLLALLLLSLAIARGDDVASEDGNPSIPFYGYSAIVVSPNPPIAGEDTAISVIVDNTGGTNVSGAVVILSYREWGASFGGLQEIGSSVVDIAANGHVVLRWAYMFPVEAQFSLEVAIDTTDMVGGNTDTTDDRGQFSVRVISSSESVVSGVPVRNDGDKEIEVKVEAVCAQDLKLPTFTLDSDDYCPQIIDVTVVGAVNGVVKIPAGGEVMAQVVMWGQRGEDDGEEPATSDQIAGTFARWGGNLMALEGEPVLAADGSFYSVQRPAEVVVTATDVNSGKQSHVKLDVVPTTVEALLNFPHFCCVEDIRLRVKLESILVRALWFYEHGNLQKLKETLVLLRHFVGQAETSTCESDTPEKTCIEKAAQAVADIGRLLTVELGVAAENTKRAKGVDGLSAELEVIEFQSGEIFARAAGGGDPKYYLEVAKANKLRGFRRSGEVLFPTEFGPLGERLAPILFPTEFGPLRGTGGTLLMRVAVKAFGRGDGAVVIAQQGFFKGVDGLSTELEVIEFQDGDDLFLRKRPGRTKYTDVSGLSAELEVIDFKSAASGGGAGGVILKKGGGKVSGLSMEMEVIEYQDGDDLILRKRPGRAKYTTEVSGLTAEIEVIEYFTSGGAGGEGGSVLTHQCADYSVESDGEATRGSCNSFSPPRECDYKLECAVDGGGGECECVVTVESQLNARKVLAAQVAGDAMKQQGLQAAACLAYGKPFGPGPSSVVHSKTGPVIYDDDGKEVNRKRAGGRQYNPS